MTRQRLDLRRVREAHDLPLREVARRADVDPTQLSRVERGLRIPSPGFVIRVGRGLGLKDLVSTLERVWGEG